MRLVARKVLRCLSVPIRLLLMLALIALRNAARFECGRALSNWAARAFCLASARASAFHSMWDRHSAYCCACSCSFTYCCCHASGSAAAANALAMAPAPARVPAPVARAPVVESCVECCCSRCRRRSSCSAHRCSRSRSDVIPSMPRHKCLAHAAPRWR